MNFWTRGYRVSGNQTRTCAGTVESATFLSQCYHSSLPTQGFRLTQLNMAQTDGKLNTIARAVGQAILLELVPASHATPPSSDL